MDVAWFESSVGKRGRKIIRGGEDRPAAQGSNPRFVEQTLVAGHARRFLGTRSGLLQASACAAGGVSDQSHRAEQALPVFHRDASQHAAIGGDRFEQFGGGAEALSQRGIPCVSGRHVREPQ